MEDWIFATLWLNFDESVWMGSKLYDEFRNRHQTFQADKVSAIQCMIPKSDSVPPTELESDRLVVTRLVNALIVILERRGLINQIETLLKTDYVEKSVHSIS